MRYSQDKAGFSLVELLVAIGIMSIIMAGMAALGVNLSRESKALQQKLETIEMEQVLVRLMSERSACDCMFRGIDWRSDAAMEIPLLAKGCNSTPGSYLISAGKPLSDYGAGVEISRISLQNPTDIGGNNRVADLVIEFSRSSLIRPLRPLRIPSQSFVLSGTSIGQCMGIAGSEVLCHDLGGTWSSGSCQFPQVGGDLACTSAGGRMINGTCVMSPQRGLKGAFMPHAGKTISCTDSSGRTVLARARVLADGTPQLGRENLRTREIEWSDGVMASGGGIVAGAGTSVSLTTSGLAVTINVPRSDSGDSNGIPARTVGCSASWPLD